MRGSSRRWYWSGVVAALAITAAGIGAAAAGVVRSGRVESTVERYFDAVADGRAADALALGAIPAGNRAYLTQEVLAAQREVGRIADLDVGAVTRTDAEASVEVSYTLVTDAGDVAVSDTVQLERDGWNWRMRAVAVPVRLEAPDAALRLALAGTALPTDAVLMFPGSLPLSTNSALLAVERSTTVARFAQTEAIAVGVVVPEAGQQAAAAALDAAVVACLAPGGAQADPTCPTTVPGVRFVPGSMTGTLTQPPSAAELSYIVTPDADGRIAVRGSIGVQAQWRQLNFNNLSEPHSGELTLTLNATIPAVEPLIVLWGTDQ